MSLEELDIVLENGEHTESAEQLAEHMKEQGLPARILLGMELNDEILFRELCGKGHLILTDDENVCEQLVLDQVPVIGFLHPGSRGKDFQGVPYILKDPEQAEACYFERVYRRYTGEPWEILRTPRCIVRETVEEDADIFQKIYSDPEMTRYTPDAYLELEEERRTISDYRKYIYAFYEFGIWTVLSRDTGEVIGRAGIYLRERNRIPELGYMIARPWQNRGIAYEVCSAILEYAEKELEITEVLARVMPENEASVKLCEKLGFRHLRKEKTDGKICDCLLYSAETDLTDREEKQMEERKNAEYIADDKRYERMKYVRCGNSGLKLPVISLGLWQNFGSNGDFENMEQICHTAFDHGITHFDLANNYGPVYGAAEKNFGRILKRGLGKYRDELVISTKAGWDMWPGPYGDGGSRKYLTASLDQSLKRMGLSYVDIFYHHRPDPETPLEETAVALDSIVKSGKALYVGISNYSRKQTEEAVKIFRELKTPFIVNQRQYSMLNPAIEKEGLKSWAAENGIGLIAYCPLQQGLLTDRYRNGIPDDSRVRKKGGFLKEEDLTENLLEKLKKLRKLAEERGQTLAQMALSWVVRDGEVTGVVTGASRPSQVLENIGMIRNTHFTEEELGKIAEIIRM